MDTIEECDHEKALRVIDFVNEVIQSDVLDWEDKYDLCFDFINKNHIRKWVLWNSYYDPDATAQDDVLALRNHLQELRPKAVEMIRIANFTNSVDD